VVQQELAEHEPGAVVPGAAALELTIVVPTFNEAPNVEELVRRLGDVLGGVAWEVVFVDDDSPDGTAELVRRLARENRRVRVLHRIGRRGLSSACVEGMLSSAAPYLAVMDADLQHDEALLPRMLGVLREDAADLVVGSRYVAQGSVAGWDERRQLISRFATKLAHLVARAPIADPMSGFFMLRRDVLHDAVHRLSAIGFKILLDIMASTPRPLRLVELPYTFRDRRAGESKLDNRAVQDFLLLLLDKTIGRYVPPRFVLFTLVGGLGTFVHLAVLSALFQGLGTSFVTGQAVATLAAMVFNFSVNNVLTYRDQQLKGRAWFTGLLSFILACSVGALANVGVAAQLFAQETNWILSAVAGVIIGAVWNYAATSFYTWRRR
jgi:dolichol-phosphate mannosyltransferase